ncbi:MAG: hypothetical protein LBR10_02445 [Prevotellaceae bacterium]|jgi:hypothetical protein|nr:hypothetical protein [Prevotellaceae bacterium]
MKGRKRKKKSEDTCPQNGRAALDSNAGGQTFFFIRNWVNYYKLADMKSALERIDE